MCNRNSLVKYQYKTYFEGDCGYLSPLKSFSSNMWMTFTFSPATNRVVSIHYYLNMYCFKISLQEHFTKFTEDLSTFFPPDCTFYQFFAFISLYHYYLVTDNSPHLLTTNFVQIFTNLSHLLFLQFSLGKEQTP